ncbi:flagellar basal body-associated FliL family protein [Enterobacter sp.]|uniref:flagellar basal body-associated FliL family protein n=2 Tax=Enterobacter sp. TaxID=42895 RepID=UPI00296E2912|nr:flagellar basal body-associated FliL family protein [Enterobacter sp.]
MKKIMIAGVFSAALALVVGGGAAWGVIHYMQADKKSAATPGNNAVQKKEHNENQAFVSLPESIVTLHDAGSEDRYMLVELAMVAEDEKASKEIIADEPLYQSIVVSTLSDMKYEDVRQMKISEIKKMLIASLNAELKNRDIPAPYSDLLVKKVVFQ